MNKFPNTRHCRLGFALLSFLMSTLAFQSIALGESNPKVAVMPIQNSTDRVKPVTVSKGTAYLRGGIAASEKFIVVGAGRQNEKLKEVINQKKKESYKECYDESCQVELGKALAADTILRTNINKFGNCVLNIEMIDLAKEASVGGFQKEFNCGRDGLKEAIDAALVKLIGPRSKTKQRNNQKWEEKIDKSGSNWSVGETKEVIIQFTSTPENAVIMADDEMLCQSTPCSKSLSKGQHKISIKKEFYQPRTEVIKVQNERSFDWTLKPNFGVVKIYTEPSGLPVSVDDKERGKSPIQELRLNPGHHKVVINDQCHHKVGQKFNLNRGKKRTFKFSPEPIPSGVELSARDAEKNAIKASVYIDGEKVGKTPGRWKVPVCSERLVVETESQRYEKELDLEAREVSSPKVRFTSKKSSGDITARDYHTCALTEAGNVECWGSNKHGERAEPSGVFTHISAGVDHTCAISKAGNVKCWGGNEQLSDTLETNPPSGSFTEVSAGRKHTCAVSAKGNIECWGWDHNGVVSDAPGGSFTSVAAGYEHTCAINKGGKIKCWGDAREGKTNPPSGTFTQISAGSNHTCAVTERDTLKCWGRNWHGVTDAPSGSFAQVSAGRNHNCAVSKEGNVKCWGESDNMKTNEPPGSFTHVSAGQEHTCAFTEAGNIKCWGDFSEGQKNVPPVFEKH